MDRVGGFSDVVSLALATDAGSAYADGDLIGGKLTIPVDRFTNQDAAKFGTPANAVRTGLVQSVSVIDQARQAAAVNLYLFDKDPSATTFTANAPLNIASADMLNCIGNVQIGTGDYKSVASGSVATERNAGLVFRVQSGDNLYGALVSGGTPTYAGSSDLGLRIGMLLD